MTTVMESAGLGPLQKAIYLLDDCYEKSLYFSCLLSMFSFMSMIFVLIIRAFGPEVTWEGRDRG